MAVSLDITDRPPARLFRAGAIPIHVVLALSFLLFIAVCCVVPGLVAFHDPFATNFSLILKPPTLQHPFGADALGRDVFARVIHSASYSIQVGLGSIGFALLFAVPLGIAGGAGGPLVDSVVVRILDAVGAFPELLLAILVIALIGPGIGNLVLAMGVASIPKLARVVRVRTSIVPRS